MFSSTRTNAHPSTEEHIEDLIIEDLIIEDLIIEDLIIEDLIIEDLIEEQITGAASHRAGVAPLLYGTQ